MSKLVKQASKFCVGHNSKNSKIYGGVKFKLIENGLRFKFLKYQWNAMFTVSFALFYKNCNITDLFGDSQRAHNKTFQPNRLYYLQDRFKVEL